MKKHWSEYAKMETDNNRTIIVLQFAVYIFEHTSNRWTRITNVVFVKSSVVLKKKKKSVYEMEIIESGLYIGL